jgi:hypothetical protein
LSPKQHGSSHDKSKRGKDTQRSTKAKTAIDKAESPIPEPQMATNRAVPWQKPFQAKKLGGADNTRESKQANLSEAEKGDHPRQINASISLKPTLMCLKYKSPTKPKPTEVFIPKMLFPPSSTLHQPQDVYERKRTRTVESKISSEHERLEIPPAPSLSPVKAIAQELATIYESFVNRTLLEIENQVQSVAKDETVKQLVREAVTARMEKALEFKQRLLQIQQLQ